MKICCRGHHLQHGCSCLQHCTHHLYEEGTQEMSLWQSAGSNLQRIIPQEVKELLFVFWCQRRRKGLCEEKHLNLWACTHISMGRTFAKTLSKSNATMKRVSEIRKFEIPPVAYGCNNFLWAFCAIIFTRIVTSCIGIKASRICENSRLFNIKILSAVNFQY